MVAGPEVAVFPDIGRAATPTIGDPVLRHRSVVSQLLPIGVRYLHRCRFCLRSLWTSQRLFRQHNIIRQRGCFILQPLSIARSLQRTEQKRKIVKFQTLLLLTFQLLFQSLRQRSCLLMATWRARWQPIWVGPLRTLPRKSMMFSTLSTLSYLQQSPSLLTTSCLRLQRYRRFWFPRRDWIICIAPRRNLCHFFLFIQPQILWLCHHHLKGGGSIPLLLIVKGGNWMVLAGGFIQWDLLK